MSFLLSAKKILFFGFIFTLLLAIPLTIYLLQKQQEVRSRAAPSTTLSFSPSKQTVSIKKNVSFDIFLDPGTNQISFAKLVIAFDDTKLTLVGLEKNTVQNTLDTVLENPSPIPSSGTTPAIVSLTLSVGADPLRVLQTRAKIANITFTGKETTGSDGTKIQFVAPPPPQAPQTQILSIGSSDQPGENVLLLSSLSPATVVVEGPAAATPNPTPSPTSGASSQPSGSSSQASGGTSTTAQGGPAETGGGPVCSGFALDRSSTGEAPYLLNFTALGSHSNGAISQALFNFGDNNSQQITEGGGLGSPSIQIQTSHIYKTPGTFKATAILTDNTGATSDPSACTKTITITGEGQTEATPAAGQPLVATAPPPTIPATGPRENIIIAGITGTILSLIGVVLLFSL